MYGAVCDDYQCVARGAVCDALRATRNATQSPHTPAADRNHPRQFIPTFISKFTPILNIGWKTPFIALIEHGEQIILHCGISDQPSGRGACPSGAHPLGGPQGSLEGCTQVLYRRKWYIIYVSLLIIFI